MSIYYDKPAKPFKANLRRAGPEAANLIGAMLAGEADSRPSAAEALTHPLFMTLLEKVGPPRPRARPPTLRAHRLPVLAVGLPGALHPPHQGRPGHGRGPEGPRERAAPLASSCHELRSPVPSSLHASPTRACLREHVRIRSAGSRVAWFGSAPVGRSQRRQRRGWRRRLETEEGAGRPRVLATGPWWHAVALPLCLSGVLGVP